MDGTLAETERHGHRVAFNQAFESLGLQDRWDENLYGKLLSITGGVRRLTHYFVDYKGLPAGEATSLAEQLHPIKSQMFLRLINDDKVPPRPGVLRFLKELEQDGCRLAVATTGTRIWVEPLLDRLCARGDIEPFEVIVTGDDVLERKPDPEAFHLTLDKLGLTWEQAVIVEDSRNGVVAAKASKCVCLAVQGEYATPEDLETADLLVDNFGDDVIPTKAISNRWSVNVGPLLTPSVVRELHARASSG